MHRDYILAGFIISAALVTAAAWLIHETRNTAVLESRRDSRLLLQPEIEPVRRQAVVATQPAPVDEISRMPQQPTPPLPKARPQSPPPQKAASNSPPITVATAREALADVGRDDKAGEFWLRAINSPDLSANERRNLIEDLNEVGFADPKNLTVNDLALIESRIAILEQVGPNAMDETNAAAMQEAYKDLINMHARLTAQ